jgi:hypothetical protein
MPSQPLPVLLPTFRHEVSTTNGRAAQTRSLTPILGSALTQLTLKSAGCVAIDCDQGHFVCGREAIRLLCVPTAADT